jgi:hypothetical protein
MKTAVEWLVEQYVNKSIITIEDINQAKEMEKQQIINAYNTSFILRDKPYSTAEKYYNEQYGK